MTCGNPAFSSVDGDSVLRLDLVSIWVDLADVSVECCNASELVAATLIRTVENNQRVGGFDPPRSDPCHAPQLKPTRSVNQLPFLDFLVGADSSSSFASDCSACLSACFSSFLISSSVSRTDFLTRSLNRFSCCFSSSVGSAADTFTDSVLSADNFFLLHPTQNFAMSKFPSLSLCKNQCGGSIGAFLIDSGRVVGLFSWG